MLKNLSTPRFHDAEFVAFISEYSHGRKLISTKWDPCCRVVMNSELLDDGPGFCNGTTTLVEYWIPFKEFEVPPFQSVSAIGTTGKKNWGSWCSAIHLQDIMTQSTSTTKKSSMPSERDGLLVDSGFHPSILLSSIMAHDNEIRF